MKPPDFSAEEWEAVTRAYWYAVVRAQAAVGDVPAVVVRLADQAWIAAAVRLGGSGLLRLRDKLTLAFCDTLPQIASRGEEAPKAPIEGPHLS